MNMFITKDIKGRIISLLGRYGSISDPLAELIENSVVRHLDVKMIVEENLSYRPVTESPHVLCEFDEFPQSREIENFIRQTEACGYVNNIVPMLDLFGSIMLALCASREQIALVEKWVSQGHIGVYLMTDGGGPNLVNWNSEVTAEGEKRRITVDKIHAISAHKLGFGIIVVKKRGSYIPSIFLMPPEDCINLSRRTAGEPFLDGSLQLGDVKGEVVVDQSMQLRSGGALGVNRFLTFVRPRFVRSLMAQTRWLTGQGRVHLDQKQRQMMSDIDAISTKLAAQTVLTNDSVDEVKALKFASNEFLLSLVLSGAAPDMKDQRDLLAFSKMEGSSYRCFYEIFHSSRKARKR
ncbi:MAG: hypothetical protein HQK54_13440 [Oligoflexales bacterium]|nr:hypothetical protein [Oligoflexales bacterium]